MMCFFQFHLRRTTGAVLSVLFLAGMLVGCAGAGDTSADRDASADRPDWYRNLPTDSLHVYGVDTATGSDRMAAIQEAVMRARRTLADTLRYIPHALQGGSLPPAFEAGLRKHLSPAFSADRLTKDPAGRHMPGSGRGACDMCFEPASTDELRERNRDGDDPRGLAAATAKQTEVRRTDDGTWRAFVLLGLPVEEVAWALEQAAGTE